MKKVNQRLNTDVKTRAVNVDKRTVDIVASTTEVDDYGTRFDQSGWILDRFMKNPVINYAHDANGFTASAGLPIARAVKETVRVEDGKLQMTVEFPDEGVHDFADQVFALVRDGFLNGLSVGFVPMEDEVVEEAGELVRWFRSMELYEVSFVTIPSNSGTLVSRCSELGQDVETVRANLLQVENNFRSNEATLTTSMVVEHNDKFYDEADIRKCIDYFESRKGVMKVANKFMKEQYERNGMKPPSDLLEAWNDMPSAQVERTTKIVRNNQPKATPKVKHEARVYKVSPEDAVEIQQTLEDATAEALRSGLPKAQTEQFIDKLATQLRDKYTS